MQRSEQSKEGKVPPPKHTKNAKGNPDKQPGPHWNKTNKVFVGNLPMETKEKDLSFLFKDFGVRSVKKFQPSSSSFSKSFAFLELSSPEAAQQAIQRLNRSQFNGCHILVALKEERKVPIPAKDSTAMPDLELVPIEDVGVDRDAAVLKTGTQSQPPLEQKVQYAIPMEMRSIFLLHMLKDCFREVSWLFSVAKIAGKVGLLVMESLPQTPFFWAINLTEACHQKMQKLFTALGEAESRLPFLTARDAQRGMRCLAECVVGEEGKAWNRCWLVDKIEDLAVVFFVDFGCSATIPLRSLRKLDGDAFWSITPLAQPFMLQDEVCPPRVMMRQILKGTVAGPLDRELHILRFIPEEGLRRRRSENSGEDATPLAGGSGAESCQEKGSAASV